MLNQILEHPSTLSESLSSFISTSGGNAQLAWQMICLPFIFLIIYSTWLHQSGKWNGLGSERIFLFLTAISLIALRYPSFAAGELNPDEGEWIAGAATLIYDPRFWISVDGTTSGPLNIFPLCLLHLFDLKFSFAAARIFFIVFLLIPSIYFTYFAIKNFFNQYVARLVIVPPVLFLALTSHFDFSFYSSEYVPVFLLAIVVYLYSLFSKKPTYTLLISAGIALGLLPYAKLQSLPMGFVLGLFFLFDVLFNNSTSRWGKVRRALVFSGSALGPTLVVLVYLLQFKAFDDFWQSYVLNNVIYGSVVPLRSTLIALPKMIFLYTKSAIPYYLVVSLIPAVGVYCLFTRKNKESQLNVKLFWLIHLLFIATYYAIGKGWGFPHYQLFVFFPLALVNALYFDLIKGYERRNLSKLMLGVYTLLPLLLLWQENVLITKVLADNELPDKNPASARILRYAKPGDKLVVWGFQDVLGSNGVYYLETGLIQGTRESHSQRPEGRIGDAAQVQYYQDRFLSDIKKSQPVAIIDLSVKSIYPPADTSTFYPELEEYITKHYYLDTVFYRMETAVTASGRYKKKLRTRPTGVYIRKDRLGEVLVVK